MLEETQKIFAKRLKLLRIEKGWRQEDLAQKLGVIQTNVGNYEAGKNIPRPDTLIKIARLFDVSLDYLLGLEDEEKKDDFIKYKFKKDSLSDEELAKVFDFLNMFYDQFIAKKKVIEHF